MTRSVFRIGPGVRLEARVREAFLSVLAMIAVLRACPSS